DTSLLSWFSNVPNYYSFFFKLVTGQMKKPDEKDPNMGEGGLPCKGKEECDAYCAKPENQAECAKLKGNPEVNKNEEPKGAVSGGPGNGQNGSFSNTQGGPGGCKSQSECQTYCDKPENRQVCLQFKPSQNK
ncbi:MAG: hypothetical protein M1450_03405, partial [Patescibacteria group bacterium]|nr:hypothetical protein [Patescibacteria group bacterium]